jgi:hypothetical protein
MLKEPVAVRPIGSSLILTSRRNKQNPDPTARVRYPKQTGNEMLAGNFEYTRDARSSRKRPGCAQ